MAKYSEKSLQDLCQRLDVDAVFFTQCMEHSVVEIEVQDNQLDVFNGTLRRLRRLQRICDVFNVDIPAALLILELSERVAELEARVSPLEPTKKTADLL